MPPCPPVCVLLAMAASVGSGAGATDACTVLSVIGSWQFQSVSLVPRRKQVCVCSLLGHSVSHTGFQINSRDSFFHCQIPRLGYPTSGSNPLLPREFLLPVISLSSFVSPPGGTGSNLITSTPFVPNSMRILFMAFVREESFRQSPVHFWWEFLCM